MLGEQLYRRTRLGHGQPPSVHDLKWTSEREVVDAPFTLAMQGKIDRQADDAAPEQRAAHGLDHALFVRREPVEQKRRRGATRRRGNQKRRGYTLRLGMKLDGELRSARDVTTREDGCVAKRRSHRH